MSPDMETQTARPASHLPEQQPLGQTPYQLNPNAYGQVYTPYGMAAPPFAPGQQLQGVPGQSLPPFSDAPRPPETKAWATSKDVLHAIGFVLSVVCFGLSLSTVSDLYNDAAIAAYGIAPIAGIAFLWSAAELITRLVRKREAGIHPGAHVGMCLIIWLGALIVTALYGVFIGYDNADYDGYDCDEYNNSPEEDPYYYSDCGNPWGGKYGILLASEILMGIIWALYFVLFVLACMDTARRNKWNGRRVIYVPHPAWGVPANAGWQKMDPYAGAPGQQPSFYQPVEQQQQQQGAPPAMAQTAYYPHGNTEYLGAAGELSSQRGLDGAHSPSADGGESAQDKGKERMASPAPGGQETGEGSTNSYLSGGNAAPRADVVEYYTPQH